MPQGRSDRAVVQSAEGVNPKAGNRRALLVGIDRYCEAIRDAAARDGRPLPDLEGCVRDTADVAELLRRQFNFPDSSVRALHDEQATCEAIRLGFSWLVDGAQAHDPLLFYFSGHGSIYRRPGGAPGTMPQFGELLCPHDMDWDAPRFISDHDLRAWTDRAPPGTTLEVVLDACCAGGMEDAASLRMQTGEASESDGVQNKFLPPPADLLAAARGAGTSSDLLSRVAEDGGSRRCIVWAATSDRGPAIIASFSGTKRSVFTYHLARELRGRAQDAKRGDVLASVARSVVARNESQEPALAPAKPAVEQGSFLIVP